MKFPNIFETLDNETMVLLIFFEVFAEMFLFLYLHLKCTVVHYANRNSKLLK